METPAPFTLPADNDPRYLAPKLLPGYVPPASGLLTLKVGCEFVYQSESPTPAVIQVEALRNSDHVILEERWETVPETPSHEYLDVFGNRCRRLVIPTGRCTLLYDALVRVTADPDEVDLAAQQTPVELLPDDTIRFTLPSRYCLSDTLLNDAWQLFGASTPGWARVQTVCDWIYHNIRYRSGSSTPLTTAYDVFQQRAGICRDFAHLGVTLCRALNIPARYVFGYFPDIGVIAPEVAMDFHAWFEVFLDGRWRSFDARHNIPRIGRVPIARGRDAIDCAMITTYGAADLLNMGVWAEERAES